MFLFLAEPFQFFDLKAALINIFQQVTMYNDNDVAHNGEPTENYRPPLQSASALLSILASLSSVNSMSLLSTTPLPA